MKKISFLFFLLLGINITSFAQANSNEENQDLTFTVNITDSIEKTPVKVTIEIEGIVPNEALLIKDTDHFTYILEKGKTYKIKCVNESFMLYTKEIDISEKSENIVLKIKLRHIIKGSSFALQDIKFKSDGAVILKSSEKELKYLVRFLETNPTTHIRINGHVNAPYQKNSIEGQKLSKERAEAVYEFLLRRGIKKNRLSYKGFGNTKMVYPKPHGTKEERSNRRVEIEITKE